MGYLDDNGALLPDLAPLIPEDIEETMDEQDIVLDNDAQSLANLAFDPGFKQIRDKLEKYVNTFRSGAAIDYDKSTPLEVIGQKFIISSTLAAMAEDVLGMVENAQKAVAERENKKRESQKSKQ
jgi:hypothetical protein